MYNNKTKMGQQREEWQRRRGIEKEKSEILKKNYLEKSQELYRRKVVKSSQMLLSIILRFVSCLRKLREIKRKWRDWVIFIIANMYWHPSV